MSMGFEHWVDDGNREWLENNKNNKVPERYEQVLGGGYMERRDWKGYKQYNLNIIPTPITT